MSDKKYKKASSTIAIIATALGLTLTGTNVWDMVRSSDNLDVTLNNDVANLKRESAVNAKAIEQLKHDVIGIKHQQIETSADIRYIRHKLDSVTEIHVKHNYRENNLRNYPSQV